MKRLILILAIVLVFAATPLFAKGSDPFVAVGCDVTLPTYDFMKAFRGDAALTFGYIGTGEKDLSFGFYSYNTLRVPFCGYNQMFGFDMIDISNFTGLYLAGIEGVEIAIPLASKLDLVVGLGASLALDSLFSWNNNPALRSVFADLGVGARVDLLFNISDSFFLDLGIEGSFIVYEYANFPSLNDSDFSQVNRWDYPSCGLKAGIKF